MSFSRHNPSGRDRVSVHGLKPERKRLLKGALSAKEIIEELKASSSPENVEGMARFGINPYNTLGVSVADLRKIAKEIGTDYKLAGELWASGIHEARILAGLVHDPAMLTESQMEKWVKEFDSWDICDQVCSNLFDKTPFAYRKAVEWSGREEEFVKRAGFAMMAALSVHDKAVSDSVFERFLPLIKKAATDDRNFVKKAVNWALRQIGKRNLVLNRKAIETAEKIGRLDSPSAKWIAMDALRELKSEAVQNRLHKRL
jgi:3-methyladenine DNA glycosylase AlkD